MDAAFERRAMRTFEALLDAAPAARDHRLRELCDGDGALESAVAELMRADAAAEALPMPERRSMEPPPIPSSPERIQDYRLTAELGRGGMGIVYRGERDDGVFDQQVAIKLIREGLFSETARAQFAAERRILARLHHPHIAQLFDGGVTAEGASYIVMELIDGAQITDHVDAANCDLPERLRLFEAVCGAVEHAHRMLVVHGDIKPSNVVVDRRCGVKLLDFGIARLLDQPGLAEAVPYTAGFATPERRAGQPLTTGDDIFALGKLLGQLIAPMREADADLYAVAAKAAAEDPDDRYATVEALVADLSRWRGRFPVTARAAPTSRRVKLFWRRHRLAVSAAVAVTASLLVAIASLVALLITAERQRHIADIRAGAAMRLGEAVTHEAIVAGWRHVRLAQSRVAAKPGDPGVRRAVASSLIPLARTYLAAGDRAHGCALLREARAGLAAADARTAAGACPGW